ncbi:MAG: helix-turn-helix transcriptional regulator, partial [Elusimicrobia bacterium]|nr:helix-turn-helix transcriptional regulator [Elusimicrobiota bacterium]
MVVWPLGPTHSENIIGLVLNKAFFWQTHATVKLSPRQRKAVSRLLDEPAGFSAGLTTRHYVGLTKASRATAYREIIDLIEKGLLWHHNGQGRNVRYELMMPGTNISPTNLSLLENGRVDIGKHRAEQLAKAFGVHPAVIMFPEYES